MKMNMPLAFIIVLLTPFIHFIRACLYLLFYILKLFKII